VSPDKELDECQAVAEDAKVKLETRPHRCTGLRPGHVRVGWHRFDAGDADDGGYAGAVGRCYRLVRISEQEGVGIIGYVH